MRSAISALAFIITGFVAGAIFFIAVSLVLAWTGPTSAPPNSNVSAPLNVGTTDQIKNASLGLNSLAVFGNAILSGTSRYLNFGTTAGSSGYGIRDNSGIMEVKSSAGSWSALLSASSTFSQIKFADGTVQTTAAASNATFKYCTNAQTAGTDSDCVAAGTNGYGTASIRALNCLSAPPYNYYTAALLSWDANARAWYYSSGGWYLCLDGSVLIIKLSSF